MCTMLLFSVTVSLARLWQMFYVCAGVVIIEVHKD